MLHRRPSMPSSNLPPFDPRGNRYDMSTFWGRLQHCRELVNPSTLLTSEKDLNASLDLLKRFDRGEASGVSDAQLWEAKRIKDAESSQHPAPHTSTHTHLPATPLSHHPTYTHPAHHKRSTHPPPPPPSPTLTSLSPQ